MEKAMDKSQGKISAAYMIKILDHYKYKPFLFEPISNMAKDFDLSKPTNLIPISEYVDICNWILENTGELNTRILGKELGLAAYHQMVTHQMIPAFANAKEVIKGLEKISSLLIESEEEINWKVTEEGDDYIVIRRNQTFNSIIQLGMLEALVKKSGALLPDVVLTSSTEQGQPYDEYLITWMNK